MRDMQQALVQAEQQLAQAQAQLQRAIPAQQEHRQLVRKLQTTQRACWNQSLSAELSGLIFGKTSRYNVRMVAVSCPLLRGTANAAEPITFEVSPWSRTRVAAGGMHALCVNAAGRAFGWGLNTSGQLGVGNTETNKQLPTLVTRLLKTMIVVQATAGFQHTACLTSDGLVFMGGSNECGQLGVGDTKGRVLPTMVRGGLGGKKVLQVAAGAGHTMCLAGGGSAFAFGVNEYGQLGLGDTDDRLVPTLLVVEIDHKSVVQVAAGARHTMFVTEDGLLFASGCHRQGQLGLDDDESRLVPTLVTMLLPGKTAVCVAAGDLHTLCITADGSLFAWGFNERGQLGVGDREFRRMPTLVTGLQDKHVVHVAGGEHHSICSTRDGSALRGVLVTVGCWFLATMRS